MCASLQQPQSTRTALLFISIIIIIIIASSTTAAFVLGFTPSSSSSLLSVQSARRIGLSPQVTATVLLYNAVDNDTDKVSASKDSAFVPLSAEEGEDEDDEDDEDVLEKVEMFGKGAAKVGPMYEKKTRMLTFISLI
jgi:hypothetical protein